MSGQDPIVAFAGPSIDHDMARGILGPDAIVLPPASAGDLIRSLRLGPRTIVLLDGRFDDVPSPWHKELLLAIEHGVHVFGGASMGALRAIECEPFGAVAVGRIADSYRAGRCEDDAVAITHLPAAGGWRPISTALVDIEAVVESRTTEGAISTTQGEEILRVARETHFVHRSLPAELVADDQSPGLKESDAILTCRRAAETTTRRDAGPRVPRTTWLLRLARFALGSPLPACPGLPEAERRFREAVDADPWLAPLISDAITFGTIKTPSDGSNMPTRRRERLLAHHRSRVDASSARSDLGDRMARTICDRQAAILESTTGVSLGECFRTLLPPAGDAGVLDDMLARLIRSEGIPPVVDGILDSDPRRSFDMVLPLVRPEDHQ